MLLGAKRDHFKYEEHQEGLDPKRKVRSPMDFEKFRDLAKYGYISQGASHWIMSIAKWVSEYYGPKFSFPCQVTRFNFFQLVFLTIGIKIQILVISIQFLFMPWFAFACLYLLPCIHQVYLMVGLLGFILTLGANLHGLNCLGARHIACFTIVHLICAKVQIVDISPEYHLRK